ncbi:MAG: AMIN domain-containing protein [Deltaproteobacteria bacterium]|nr:AMIN domain-containing protein [Deltaproteobacteria bacterium]
MGRSTNLFSILLTPVPTENSFAQKALPNAKGIIDVVVTPKSNGLEVSMKGDGLILDYQSFRLEDPPRLVVDFPNMMNTYGKKKIHVGKPLLGDIRIGQHPEKVRFVFYFPGDKIPSYQTSWDGPQLKFLFLRPAPETKVPEKTATAITPPKPEKPAQTPAVPPPPQVGKALTPKAEAPPEMKKEEGAKEKMAAAPEPQKPLPAPGVERQAPEKPKAVPVSRPEEKPAVRTAEPPPEVPKEVKSDGTVAGKPAPQKREAPPETKRDKDSVAAYRGKNISLDVKDADIRSVLRLISEISGRRIVADGDVQGKITTRLTNVPWDQALDVILEYHQWKKTEEGNTIRISNGD